MSDPQTRDIQADTVVMLANQIFSLAAYGELARFVVVDATLTPRESYESDGTLGLGAYWGDDDVWFARGAITDDESHAAVRALTFSAGVGVERVSVALTVEGGDPMRACVLVADENRELPNLLAQVDTVTSTIRGVKGFDVCDTSGRVVTAGK